jgi:hypothetical protein
MQMPIHAQNVKPQDGNLKGSALLPNKEKGFRGCLRALGLQLSQDGMQNSVRKMVCLGIPQILFFGKTLRIKIQNLLKIAEVSGLH